MRRWGSIVLTVLVSGASLVTWGAGPALACSCAYQRTGEFAAAADEIFTGTLTAMTEPPRTGVVSSTDPITYTVAVDVVYRGDVGSVAFFESAMSGASCGLEGMAVDRRYLVFVTTDGSERAATSCGGTAPATPGRVDAIERLTGAPAEPAVATDATTSRAADGARSELDSGLEAVPAWTIVTAGIGAAVLLLGAGLRRRRRPGAR
ncbi:unannotated protein [freshwater metagenome]|uniref:Unannotated protein n=1 Tax=freshwater metagenome TaxID=449393 RepID=A0A6J7L427_9ZZZZ|nr:hypothetical protein [Actinomycetota bacterium]